MKISLDDGETYQDVSSIRIIYDIDLDAADLRNSQAELHLNYTPEGVVTDLWGSINESLDTNLGTESKTIGELADEVESKDITRICNQIRMEGFSVKDDGLYHDLFEECLGEWDEFVDDGKFVPSKFLLELPHQWHESVEKFVSNFVPGK